MMSPHSVHDDFMDWEPTESFDMDVDEKSPLQNPMTPEPFSDVYMASPTVEDVHMASPTLTSQPLNAPLHIINSGTFFLPPLEFNTKPIVFPPLNIYFDVYMPATQAESPAMTGESSQGVTYTSTVHNLGHPGPVTFQDTETIPLGGRSDWIVEQDNTPSTLHPFVAESNTPRWLNFVDKDAMPNSQYPILETTTPVAICPEYVGSSQHSDEDHSVLRVFGGSSLEDLDWVLEGFRVANVPDTHTEPYDWAPVSEADSDLIFFDSAHDLHRRSVETSLVLANTHCGSFELPSSKSGDVNQRESNTLFQTSTPAPCGKSISEESLSLAAEPILDNMASYGTEIVTDTDEINCRPVSDIPGTSDVLCSPFNPIYHEGTTLDGFSKAAYIAERKALRNVKAFKSKLSFEVQKLRARTKKSTGFLKFLASSPQDVDIPTTRHVGQKTDIEHDVFGEVADTRSNKRVASAQTEKLPDAAYSTSFEMIWFSMFIYFFLPLELRPPRRRLRYVRYSPYRKSSRDFTSDLSDSVDLEHSQLVREESDCTISPGTSCGPPSPVDDVFLGRSVQGSIISQYELETDLAVRVDLRGTEDHEKEMAFPGAYSTQQFVYTFDDLEYTQHTVAPCASWGFPSPVHNVFSGFDIQGSIISQRELETGWAVHVDSREPEEDDQETEKTFPGAYPIERVVYALDKPATRIVKAAQKKHFEKEVISCPTVRPSAQCGFTKSFYKFFAYLFDW